MEITYPYTLLYFRKKAGLTQAELAQRLNVDASAVSNWERGINPPLRKYRKLMADALDCTVKDLFPNI